MKRFPPQASRIASAESLPLRIRKAPRLTLKTPSKLKHVALTCSPPFPMKSPAPMLWDLDESPLLDQSSEPTTSGGTTRSVSSG